MQFCTDRLSVMYLFCRSHFPRSFASAAFGLHCLTCENKMQFYTAGISTAATLCEKKKSTNAAVSSRAGYEACKNACLNAAQTWNRLLGNCALYTPVLITSPRLAQCILVLCRGFPEKQACFESYMFTCKFSRRRGSAPKRSLSRVQTVSWRKKSDYGASETQLEF